MNGWFSRECDHTTNELLWQCTWWAKWFRASESALICSRRVGKIQRIYKYVQPTWFYLINCTHVLSVSCGSSRDFRTIFVSCYQCYLKCRGNVRCCISYAAICHWRETHPSWPVQSVAGCHSRKEFRKTSIMNIILGKFPQKLNRFCSSHLNRSYCCIGEPSPCPPMSYSTGEADHYLHTYWWPKK